MLKVHIFTFCARSLLVACSFSSLACSSSTGAGTPVVTPPPVSVAIADPSNGAMIAYASLQGGADYALSYSAENFTIAAPGECAGKASPCGHGRVWVDDMVCNDHDNGLPYNAEGISPISVGFDYCANLYGPHDIKLVLYRDDGTLFTAPATGAEVSASIQVTILSASAGLAGSGGGGGTGGGTGGSGSGGSGG